MKTMKNCLCACAAWGAGGAALAADAAAPVVDELIVTAQKREQGVNDVGIAITGFNAEAVRAFGLDESFDIAAYTPGLNMVANAGYSGKINFTLRGVGLDNYSEAQEAAVAIYQDEVYIAPLVGSVVGGFDLDRIEVLRGPQGTLFGRSATGGLVHYLSRRPSDEFEGYVGAGYGSFDERRAEGAVGGPLSDRISVRVAGYWNKYDGWLENTIGSDRYGEERWAVRGQVSVRPADGLELLLKAEYGELDNPDGVVYLAENVYRTPDGVIRDLPPNLDAHFSGPGNDFTGFRDTDGEFFTGTWGQSGINKVDRALYSAIFTWDLGGVTLTSLSSHLRANKDYLDSNDASPTDYLRVGQFPRAKEFIQELRLASDAGPLRWTVGGFYFDFDVRNANSVGLPSGILPLLGGFFGASGGLDNATTPFQIVSFADQSKQSIAAYGQLEYDLTDDFTAIVGLRYEHEDVDFAFDQSRDNAVALFWAGAPFAFNETLYDGLSKIDKNYVSGTAELDWKPNEDILAYASFRRGIKPGAFNTPFLSLPPDQMKVNEEKLHAFELGVKATLFGGRAQANASAFYYDYNDYQATFLEGATVVLTNADAELYGLDLDISVVPADGLTLGAAASFLEGCVKDIALATAGGPIVRDREPTNAPNYSANAYARYEWRALGGEMSLQGDVSFRGKTFFEIQNHPALTADSYAVGNIRAAWRRDNLEIAGFVKNIWNEKYEAYLLEVVDFGGYKNVTPGKPRWAGVEVRYSWGE